jgi:hypothetical protein
MFGDDGHGLGEGGAGLDEVVDERLVVSLQFVDEFLSLFALSTRALVVPPRALSTTMVRTDLSAVINWLTWRIRSGLPTEVPPNFITLS